MKYKQLQNAVTSIGKKNQSLHIKLSRKTHAINKFEDLLKTLMNENLLTIEDSIEVGKTIQRYV